MSIEKEQKPTAIVAYHGHCIDGYTAAWVATRALEGKGEIVKMVAMHYSEASYKELLDCIKHIGRVEELYIVDFSIPLYYLEKYSALSNQVVILDHHKTAFENYGWEGEVKEFSCMRCTMFSNVIIILDSYHSGASLTWRYFNLNENTPMFIQYVRDYDLWKFKIARYKRNK